MKTAVEEGKIVLRQLSGPVKLVVPKNVDGDDFCAKLGRAAAEIAGMSGLISVEDSDVASDVFSPSIWIQTEKRRNFYYSAFPVAGEFMPFVKALVQLSKGQANLEKQAALRLNALTQEIFLELLIAESCPFCPKMVELVSRLAACNASVKVHVIDMVRASYNSGSLQVRSVPALIINGKVLHMGFIDESGVVALMEKTVDKTRLIDLLATNLLMGNSEKAMEIILQENRPALLVDLVAREEFTVRLGAMMLAETLHTESPEMTKSLVPGLIGLLETESLNVRGDAAYLLGMLGDARARDPLKKLLSEKNEDLLGIVREALSALE